MSEWQEYRLDEICQIVGGGTPSSKIDSYWDGDVGWITPADLSGYQFKHISNGARNITELGLEKSSAKLHPKNTVLFSSRAPIGYLAIASKPLATNQGFQSLRCNEKIADFNFVYYLLMAYKEGIASIASGATFPEVSGGKIKQFKINLPPLSEQKKISKILSNYDDLIENNLNRIELLEENAKLTYEEWFLRFRIDGKKLDIDPTTGLPFGWKEVKLGDVCELNYGKALIASSRKDGEYPVYGSSGVVGRHNEYICNGKGIILGRKGNVGSVFWSEVNFYPIDTCFYITSKISLHFIYFLLNNMSFINNDAAVPGLNRSAAYSMKCTIPDEILVKHFTKIIKPLFSQIQNYENQNQLLQEARDILLPRLMTGMIDTDELDIAV